MSIWFKLIKLSNIITIQIVSEHFYPNACGVLNHFYHNRTLKWPYYVPYPVFCNEHVLFPSQWNCSYAGTRFLGRCLVSPSYSIVPLPLIGVCNLCITMEVHFVYIS